jgi:hypothetical protein
MGRDETAGLEHRLAAGEREILALKATVAELGRRVPPARVAPVLGDEAGVKITYPRVASIVALPNPEQLVGLQEIVLHRYPKLAPADDLESKWRRDKEFEAAFVGLAQFGRGELDT